MVSVLPLTLLISQKHTKVYSAAVGEDKAHELVYTTPSDEGFRRPHSLWSFNSLFLFYTAF